MKLKKTRPFQWRTGKHRRLSENGYFSQSLRQAEIIILEILLCIPVVIISSFLELEKKYLILGQPP